MNEGNWGGHEGVEGLTFWVELGLGFPEGLRDQRPREGRCEGGG